MEFIAIALARLVAFLDIQALDPHGKTSVTEAFKILGTRYSFVKTPQAREDLDFKKGVEFAVGKLSDINIDKLVIYNNGLVIDTHSSTSDSDKVLNDFLGVAKEAFGANLRPSRRNLVSQIIFRSELRLALLNPVLQPLADRIAATVSRELGQSVTYEPTGLSLGTDLSQIQLEPVALTIERRAAVPFSQNIYFSSAPLHTAEHWEILEQVEASLLPR